MDFNIFYNKEALSDLEKLKVRAFNDCQIILKKIESILSTNPFPRGKIIKKLKNIQPYLYRLRVNASVSYRIFYRIMGGSVYILKVVSKKDSDKVLRNYF